MHCMTLLQRLRPDLLVGHREIDTVGLRLQGQILASNLPQTHKKADNPMDCVVEDTGAMLVDQAAQLA